jgi:hypothetical protein
MQTSSSTPFGHWEHHATPTKQQSTKPLVTIVPPVFSFMAVELSD